MEIKNIKENTRACNTAFFGCLTGAAIAGSNGSSPLEVHVTILSDTVLNLKSD
jgi:hypothetical protein